MTSETTEETLETLLEDTHSAAAPKGPQHSYGLRLAPDNPDDPRKEELYYVVRVTPEGEIPVSRPEYRFLAVELLYCAVEDDSWGALDVADDRVEMG